MNILIVGSGKGSFQMRAVQLGAALGARVTSDPADADWHWADRVVLLKRAGPTFANRVHARGVPLIWDAVDFWRQPSENRLGEPQAIALLHRTVKTIRPTLTIGATKAMAAACDGVYLPHHSWDGLTPAPVRDRVQAVAYEGNPTYLGPWRGVIERACAARGWAFVVNPPDLREADIIVAVRGGQWDGWICREWKSGVKVVNAIAAGRPVISQPTAAFRELQAPGTSLTCTCRVEAALDAWAPHAARAAVVEQCATLAPTYTVAAVAARYRAALETLRREVAA